MALLEVEDLHITFRSHERVTEAVRGISFALDAGKTLAVVGESGSGKSVSAMSLTRLLPPEPICELRGQIRFAKANVMGLPPRALRQLRGRQIAYIFQEASASLNPVFTVGYQIAEAVKLHFPKETAVRARVVAAMEAVGIRDAARRYDAYPHELSGGMQQRIMIAMALACEPRLLVADEPTTALDVTIQAQIMDLLREVRERTGMAIILITHNFGIVKGFADEVLVMYQGKAVERGPTEDILAHPQHPYTKALIGCIPRLGDQRHRLPTINHALLK